MSIDIRAGEQHGSLCSPAIMVFLLRSTRPAGNTLFNILIPFNGIMFVLLLLTKVFVFAGTIITCKGTYYMQG